MTSAKNETSTPTRTAEERPSRTSRRARVTTILIGVIILATIAAAVLFQAAAAFRSATPSPGDSRFDLAGVKVIHGSADVQIDVRKPLRAKSVGLPANATRTLGPYGGIQLEVDLVGSHDTESIFVDQMRVATRDGLVTSISTSTTNVGYVFIRSQIAALDVLGLTPSQTANFENAMPDGAGGPTSRFNLPFGTGTALGVPTAVRISCAGPKGCTVSTNTTLLRK